MVTKNKFFTFPARLTPLSHVYIDTTRKYRRHKQYLHEAFANFFLSIYVSDLGSI